MVMEDHLTLGGGYTMQYTDEVYAWNLYNFINQYYSYKFNKRKKFKLNKKVV